MAIKQTTPQPNPTQQPLVIEPAMKMEIKDSKDGNGELLLFFIFVVFIT